MPIFDRKSGRKAPESEPSDNPESDASDAPESEGSDQAESEPSDNVMVSRLSRYSTEFEHQTPALPVAEVEAEVETTEQIPDYAELGEHVGAVLESAKEAAEKMRLQAAEVARQTRADADLKARATVEEAQKQARQVEASAAMLEAEATERSTKIGNEAEVYARATREAADEQAAAVLDRAQRQASERVRATQERLQALNGDVAGTEQRLRQLIAWMRDCVSSLEDLVAGSVPSEKESTAPEAERASLTDDLSPSGAGQRLSNSQ